MKKFFTSWTPWMTLIIIGGFAWFLSALLPKPPPQEISFGINKSFGSEVPKHITSIYTEVKFWVEFIGRCMMGVGGVAGTIKIISELFRRKKNE